MRHAAPIPTQSDARGYAMAVLLVAMAVMLTLMTVAMPVWRQQQKREREEELLFRLRQYAHALVLYQRRMPGAAPATVDDLVKQRFLRRKYKDPMTGKDFAVLRVGQVSPGMTATMPGVNVPNPGSSSGPGQTSTPAVRGTTGSQTGGRAGSGFSVNPSGVGTTGTGTQMGAVRGVVSTSTESSLRIWKGRTRYDQWEVSIEDLTPRMFGSQVPQPGENRRQPGQSRPGQTPPGQSPTQLPNNPYGGTIRR